MSAGVVWALASMRVICALVRVDPPSHEVDIAWLIVVVAPIVIWKEIAARRDRASHDGRDREPPGPSSRDA